MWQLFLQSQEYHTRASDLLAIEDSYTAYCLDEAVWVFGTSVRERIREASSSKGKNDTEDKQRARAENALREALGLPRKYRPMNVG
jgi:uncharacterized protein (DUF2252 family)